MASTQPVQHLLNGSRPIHVALQHWQTTSMSKQGLREQGLASIVVVEVSVCCVYVSIITCCKKRRQNPPHNFENNESLRRSYTQRPVGNHGVVNSGRNAAHGISQIMCFLDSIQPIRGSRLSNTCHSQAFPCSICMLSHAPAMSK